MVVQQRPVRELCSKDCAERDITVRVLIRASCVAVIFLLGWTGCSPRHLSKYAELYSAMGYRPICFTEHCPLTALASLTSLARQLLERASEERPLAVHVFSNGGCFLWARALGMDQQGALDRCYVLCFRTARSRVKCGRAMAAYLCG